MTIFGVALLAICTLVGAFLGDLLGVMLGAKTNVGGVGLAMILLIAGRAWLIRKGGLSHGFKLGIEFWAALYIPIVVAMASIQNVVAAVSGGPVVLIAGGGTVILCFACTALLSRIARPPEAIHDRGQEAHAARVLSGAAEAGAAAMLGELLKRLADEHSLIMAFAAVGAVMWFSYQISKHLTFGRIHGSAIAIVLGLALAYAGGIATGGKNGLADIPMFAGLGLLGGAMIRDFAIVATAFEVDVQEAKRAGLLGAIALTIGTILPFIFGASVAGAFGYTDAVSLTTIGAGAITYIVGPVTGSAIGASSPVMALSIATGVFKAVLVMIGTPFLAQMIGLDNPRSAMAFGGLMGTVSGVTGGLAATDPRLVPYGALTATFHTGIGCLVAPSIFYFIVRAMVGA